MPSLGSMYRVRSPAVIDYPRDTPVWGAPYYAPEIRCFPSIPSRQDRIASYAQAVLQATRPIVPRLQFNEALPPGRYYMPDLRWPFHTM